MNTLKALLISLILSQIFFSRPVLAQNDALAGGTPAPATHCSKKMIDTLNHSRNQIDAADTAGDSTRVIEITKNDIEIATLCLDDLPDDAPAWKRIIMRNNILSSLSFEMDASVHGGVGADTNKLLSNETRIAIAQCNESDLENSQDLFVKARELIGFVLNRDAKILSYSGTPIDDYRSDLRKCSLLLGRNYRF